MKSWNKQLHELASGSSYYHELYHVYHVVHACGPMAAQLAYLNQTIFHVSHVALNQLLNR